MNKSSTFSFIKVALFLFCATLLLAFVALVNTWKMSPGKSWSEFWAALRWEDLLFGWPGIAFTILAVILIAYSLTQMFRTTNEKNGE